MRILYVIHQFFPEFRTGTERVTLNIARSMQRAGHYVHILSCVVRRDAIMADPSERIGDAIDYVWNGLPVTAISRDRLAALAEIGFWAHPLLIREIAAFMTSSQFDCIHVMHPMRMAAALRAAQLAALPVVVTATDFFAGCYRVNLVAESGHLCAGPAEGRRCATECPDPRWSDALLTRRHAQARAWLTSASERVAPSAYVAATMATIFPDLPFRVIPHGVTMDAAAGDDTDAAPGDADGHAPSPGHIRFGYVGTIVPHKGLLTLLQAFQQVDSPGISLSIFGGTYDGSDYANAARDLAGRDRRVKWCGEVAHRDLCRALGELDVLCLPSQVPETFSMSFHEAKAAGVPALVSDLGAPAADIRNSGAGMVVPAGDIGAWRDALAAVAGQPDLRACWAAALNLPSRIEEEAFFYESLYRQYVGKTNTPPAP